MPKPNCLQGRGSVGLFGWQYGLTSPASRRVYHTAAHRSPHSEPWPFLSCPRPALPSTSDTARRRPEAASAPPDRASLTHPACQTDGERTQNAESTRPRSGLPQEGAGKPFSSRTGYSSLQPHFRTSRAPDRSVEGLSICKRQERRPRSPLPILLASSPKELQGRGLMETRRRRAVEPHKTVQFIDITFLQCGGRQGLLMLAKDCGGSTRGPTQGCLRHITNLVHLYRGSYSVQRSTASTENLALLTFDASSAAVVMHLSWPGRLSMRRPHKGQKHACGVLLA